MSIRWGVIWWAIGAALLASAVFYGVIWLRTDLAARGLPVELTAFGAAFLAWWIVTAVAYAMRR